METKDETPDQKETNQWQDYYNHHHPAAGRVLGGIVLVGIGAVLLLEKMGYFFPHWVFTWKMMLIAIGIYFGAKHLFRGFGWMIPIIIGVLFLADDFIPGLDIYPFIWPSVIVMIGLFMIFRPKRMYRPQYWRHRGSHNRGKLYNDGKWHEKYYGTPDSSEDRLDAVVVFGSTKKNVISKDFKGGEITCVFGGAEINLNQADINGKVVLELNQVFGGTKLVVPPHWQVNHHETVSFMGGIEDRRPDNNSNETNKILIVKGVSVFGGLEISSY